MAKVKQLPKRSHVKAADSWDLTSLLANDAEWEAAFQAWQQQTPRYENFRGKLGESASELAACLRFDNDFERTAERIGTYAFLKTAEDTANSDYQRMIGRYRHAASQAAQASSYIRPEIMAIDPVVMDEFMASSEMTDFRVALERLLRYRPYTLGKGEEKLLAMQSEMAETSNQVFRQLTDADLKWGMIRNEKGELVELSNSSFSAFLHSPKRSVRKTAFHKYYAQFADHQNTLAATLAGSVQRDVFYAKARGYDSALAASLFHDRVPVSVYDNLIEAVHRHLPALYQYYDVRRRKMRLADIHHFDTYVPILSQLETRHTWSQAVNLVLAALEPLGDEYRGVLDEGLNGRWCDRYPNQGKQSGAFSCGSYDAAPYILMNYQPNVLDHVFTLAHEAGHSMHSYYSAKNQPFQYYNYTIFVAEVASTFNEQLLARHLMARARTAEQRAFLVNREIDSIRGTILRQTMFAEFERTMHTLVEAGEPLTVERFKTEYRRLLEQYFGPDFAIDDELSLECFRIPHFYRAFYVYKYATGLSAAIALADRVTSGGADELHQYLAFLKGGCSQYPLELLRSAGVDMEQTGAVDTALDYFARLVRELDELL